MTALAFINSAKPLIVALVFFAFLITGVGLICPSDESKQIVKHAFPLIIISSAIALGSIAIAA